MPTKAAKLFTVSSKSFCTLSSEKLVFMPESQLFWLSRLLRFPRPNLLLGFPLESLQPFFPFFLHRNSSTGGIFELDFPTGEFDPAIGTEATPLVVFVRKYMSKHFDSYGTFIQLNVRNDKL